MFFQFAINDRKNQKKGQTKGMDFVLENWKLIVSVVLSIVNLIITLSVHSRSSQKIKVLEDKNENGVPDLIEQVLSLNSKILEELKNEKTATKKGEDESVA